jgi:glycine/D-amino acid oxidase-like deaminating enzyme
MLPFDKLSYWEKVTYFQNVDYVVIGSGIVGLSTALHLRKRENHAKILVLERGYLPTGASTKNAGFACFGSPSELLSDIQLMGESKTAELLKLRWDGLQLLLNTLGRANLEYRACGSYDLFRDQEVEEFENVRAQLSFLNYFIEQHLGLTSCYEVSNEPLNQGLRDLSGCIFNRYEGSINTGKMMEKLIQLIYASGISILSGIDVLGFEDLGKRAVIDTQFGKFEANHVFICTNGLSKKLLPDLDLQPARAQVLVTSPIPNLKLNSTYHYDSGFFYFRAIEKNRVLIGGARNKDFIGETTEEMSVTENIKNHILALLKEVVLPNQDFDIEYEWAGIMGVGSEKIPLIQSKSPRVHFAVRMGGMGVAMGMEIGRCLSQLV